MPAENLLGTPDIDPERGFGGVMQTFDNTRAAGRGDGGRRRAGGPRAHPELLDEAGIAIDYDAPATVQQAAAAEFLTAEADYEAAYLLTLRAAWLADNGTPDWLEASMAKAKAGRAATDIALRCVALAGTVGYGEGRALGEVGERRRRSSTSSKATQQIQQLIVARRLLGKTSAGAALIHGRCRAGTTEHRAAAPQARPAERRTVMSQGTDTGNRPPLSALQGAGGRGKSLSILVRSGVLGGGLPHRTVKRLGALAKYGPTLAGAFTAGRARAPKRVAVTDEQRSVTYEELYQRVQRIAAGLAGLGAGATGRSRCTSATRSTRSETLVSASRAGADALLLNTFLSPTQVTEVLHRERPAVLVVDAELRPNVVDVPDGTTVVIGAPEDGVGLGDADDRRPRRDTGAPTCRSRPARAASSC